jgi:hypothetical protein
MRYTQRRYQSKCEPSNEDHSLAVRTIEVQLIPLCKMESSDDDEKESELSTINKNREAQFEADFEVQRRADQEGELEEEKGNLKDPEGLEEEDEEEEEGGEKEDKEKEKDAKERLPAQEAIHKKGSVSSLSSLFLYLYFEGSRFPFFLLLSFSVVRTK